MGGNIIPKNRKGGIVTNVALGVGGMIIAVIVVLLIIQTTFNGDLLPDNSATTPAYRVVSEHAVNSENYTKFGNYTLPGAYCTITNATNMSTGKIIEPANYTVDSTNCQVKFISVSTTDDTGYNMTIWNISSVTSFKVDTEYNITAQDMNRNFSTGLGNISSKLPTILLIVAVVFLFGALALLIRNSNAIGSIFGGNSNSGSL